MTTTQLNTLFEKMLDAEAAEFLNAFLSSEPGNVSSNELSEDLINVLVKLAKSDDFLKAVCHIQNKRKEDILFLAAESEAKAEAALAVFFKEKPQLESFNPKIIWIDTFKQPVLS